MGGVKKHILNRRKNAEKARESRKRKLEVVYSTMDVGLGYVGFHNFTGLMSMKPLHGKYNHFQSVVLDATKEKVMEVLNTSIEAAKSHYSANNDIYDMRVIFDGSWQKRGHTSNLAVGAVIEADTGLVLDYETMCKYCEVCTKKGNAKKQGKVSKEEFERWMTGHKEKCMKNYEGSSGGMEAAIAVKLFSRSLDKNIRYTVLISDGDSSAYNAVCDMNDGEGPYGNVKVEKGVCINYVAKRLGIALRKVREQVVTERKTKTGKVRRIKEMGANKNILEYSVAQAVLDYNAGYEKGFVLPLLGEPFTRLQQSSLQLRARKREREWRKRKQMREKDTFKDGAAGF